MDPSQLGSLKGLNQNKGHGEFILVRPLAVKVKAYDPVVVGLIGLEEQGVNMPVLASSCCLLSLNCRRVVPLYTRVDARRFTEHRGRLIHVSGSVSTFP